MDDPRGKLTIGGLAEAAGVTVETIRFYQRRDLLAEPLRRYGSVRRYSTVDVGRVRFIKAAQRLGFSLNDIVGLLRLDDGLHCSEAAELAESKLEEVRQKLAHLRQIERALNKLVTECHVGSGRVACPLITALRDSPAGEPNPAQRA